MIPCGFAGGGRIGGCHSGNDLGVSNLWNGLWNGPMEWIDGMEYQLTIIAKTHHRISAVLPLLASNGLLSLEPRTQARPHSECGTRLFRQRDFRALCALIGTSLQLAVPMLPPLFYIYILVINNC